MHNGSVDIITRTKNRPIFLKRAIRSVLDQNYQNWNHIIINDGGTADEVEKTVAPFVDQYKNRLTIIHHEKSLGMEAASNSGIRSGTGQFIVIHDDDDTWEAEFLYKTVDYLNNKPHPLISGVITWANKVTEKVEHDQLKILKKERYTKELFWIDYAEIIKNNLFTTNSFLFHRKSLEVCGFFDDTLPVLGDWEFNIRFLQHFEIGVVSEYLANYHQRPFDKNQHTGNSIHAAQNKHLFYASLVRNNFLRKDLETGKIGVGTIMMLLKELQNNDNKLKEMLSSSINHRLKKLLKGLLDKDV